MAKWKTIPCFRSGCSNPEDKYHSTLRTFYLEVFALCLSVVFCMCCPAFCFVLCCACFVDCRRFLSVCPRLATFVTFGRLSGSVDCRLWKPTLICMYIFISICERSEASGPLDSYGPLDSHPGLACTYFLLFVRPDSKIWIRHESDRRKCYGRKNTGKFGVLAIRFRWTTSRSRIRQKSKEKN